MNNNKFTKLPSSKPVIRIQTWNIKIDAFKDFETIEDSVGGMQSEIPDVDTIQQYAGFKETSWSVRRFGIVNDVLFNNPDIFCVQEALKHQLDDLDEMLSYQWKWLGVGRDDGKTDGEHTAIFVKRTAFEIIRSETLWLTHTPYEISRFPGAYANRIATLATLKHTISGDKFTVINTHWDQDSVDARILSANLLRYVGSHEYETYGYVFLTGDLNSGPTGKKSTAYKVLTGEDKEHRLIIQDAKFNQQYMSSRLSKFKFKDLLELTPSENRMGNVGTCTGWNKPTKQILERIDFIMGGVMDDEHADARNKKFEVLRFRVGENLFDNGPAISDHRPVTADIVFY